MTISFVFCVCDAQVREGVVVLRDCLCKQTVSWGRLCCVSPGEVGERAEEQPLIMLISRAPSYILYTYMNVQSVGFKVFIEHAETCLARLLTYRILLLMYNYM